jgi:hypothetical protein
MGTRHSVAWLMSSDVGGVKWDGNNSNQGRIKSLSSEIVADCCGVAAHEIENLRTLREKLLTRHAPGQCLTLLDLNLLPLLSSIPPINTPCLGATDISTEVSGVRSALITNPSAKVQLSISSKQEQCNFSILLGQSPLLERSCHLATKSDS